MSVFDPQNQILASLQQYADSALDELNGIAGNNIDKWKVGLRDIQNWDDGIIGEEVASLLELDYNIMQLLFEIVHDPPELAEFLHVFMIELSKVSCVKNREYFTKFGHVDRSNVQKSVLTRVFRKLSLRPKFKTPASTTPSLASASSKAPSKAPSRTPSRTPSKTPSRAPSTCSKRSCASTSANKSRVPNVLDQISEDQSISLAPSDSVSCLPNQKTPSVVREGSVGGATSFNQSLNNWNVSNVTSRRQPLVPSRAVILTTTAALLVARGAVRPAMLTPVSFSWIARCARRGIQISSLIAAN